MDRKAKLTTALENITGVNIAYLRMRAAR